MLNSAASLAKTIDMYKKIWIYILKYITFYSSKKDNNNKKIKIYYTGDH